MSSNAPRFISEKDIEERKARDAAEGKVEEAYDPRPLYDRLQAERARKQEEYESQKAFKNQIHRLDDEEVAFLAEKDLERCRNEESAEEEALYAVNRSALLKSSVSPAIPVKPQINRASLPTSSSTLNQKALLSGIKRKPPSSTYESAPKKPHLEQSGDTIDSNSSSSNPPTSESNAGILPGLNAYENSSDEESDDDSSTDVEDAARTISAIIDTYSKKKSDGDD
ncbi:unnamed protein product [Rodentolepis nana]|uniref:FAM192A_Fyv6_N domain-containing protein n=1 Tax=Rodentolepis nana TaxID=102285 RepID=A0A0R3TUM0_RODNA|nr:unnamed protein product [Rodentolepis nana]